MGFLGNVWRGITGQLDSSSINKTLNQGMGDIMNPMKLNAQTLAGKGQGLMDFMGSHNVNQRDMYTTAAADATATGGMQAQQMAAQQGMGGSGLLQQANANNAYSNMMKANRFGMQDTMKNFRLGSDFLNTSSNIFGNVGNMQSNINEGMANVDMYNQNAMNKFVQGAAGTALGALPGGGGAIGGVLKNLIGGGKE